MPPGPPEPPAPPAPAGQAADLIAERVARRGPLPLSEVLEVALYEPGVGFYETGGAAGRRQGDFVTSPEVGPLFGAVVARALDAWWRDLGEPDPYLVVEAGAGRGALARAVLEAGPACARALRYVLVERSATLRRRHAERKLPLVHPSLVLPPLDADTERPVPEAAPGPLCTSLAELPRLPGTSSVVLANELLDNLPFDLAERGPDGWLEVRVGRGATREVTVPLDELRAALLDRLAPDAAVGGRAPLQRAATDWLRSALATAGRRGRVVVLDYASTTAELTRRPPAGWLRTYRGHARGSGFLDDLGRQDVTCEVATDQLAAVHAPAAVRRQHEWLRAWGIDDLVAEGARVWAERAQVGDLAAVRARSRGSEAAALVDPEGLGGFHVLEWSAG
jgi:SAM-dependent MidA family methyltransferase